MNAWETREGYELIRRLISLTGDRLETKQVAKMYSALEAEDEINAMIRDENARVASVTPAGDGCILVIFEIPV